ncbi:MAG: hypothetical protein QW650_00105 [Thermofilum sp.]
MKNKKMNIENFIRVLEEDPGAIIMALILTGAALAARARLERAVAQASRKARRTRRIRRAKKRG